MKQGKTGRLQVEEHLLPIGVVFVALFWDIEPTLERFVLGEGNLLTMLLPTQPGQTWERGLLVIVLPIFACYVQKGRRSARRRIEGPRCSMGSIVESSDATVGKTLKSLTESWNLSAQNTHGCAVGNMMPLELSTTHRPFKTVRRGEPVDSFETVRGKREGGRSYVSTIGMQRCTIPA